MRFKTIGRRRRPAPITLATRLSRWLMLVLGACLDMWQCRHAALRRRSQMTTRPATSVLDEPWPAEVLEGMSPRRFEMLMQLLFARRGSTSANGMTTTTTTATTTTAAPSARTHGHARHGDSGLDIWIYRPGGGGPPTGLVQCRHWPAKRVGVDKLLPLWSLMRRHGLQHGRLATCASFTEEAVAFALDHGIELLDAELLAEMILANPAAHLLMEPAFKPMRQAARAMVRDRNQERDFGAIASIPSVG